MYATPSQLIKRFNAQELAQIAVPDEHVSIDAPLLVLTIDEGDRSAYTADEIAAADAALVRINQALTDASGDVDAHLEASYQLPLSSVPLKLEQVCCDIARYNLYDDHATDHISKRYDDAIKYLRDVAKGIIRLGIDENNASPTEDDNVVEFDEGSNVFDRDKSGSFI
jgi:phage gp36-like protein